MAQGMPDRSQQQAEDPTVEPCNLSVATLACIGVILLIGGMILPFDDSVERVAELEYVCGTNLPSQEELAQSIVPTCLLFQDEEVDHAQVPYLCLMAGSAKGGAPVYCNKFKAFSQYEPPNYLWWTERGCDKDDFDDKYRNCKRKSWQLDRWWDYQQSYLSWYQMEAANSSLESLLYPVKNKQSWKKGRTNITNDNKDRWIDSPGVIVSECPSNHSNYSYSIPETCFMEQNLYKKDSKQGDVNILMFWGGFIFLFAPVISCYYHCASAIFLSSASCTSNSFWLWEILVWLLKCFLLPIPMVLLIDIAYNCWTMVLMLGFSLSGVVMTTLAFPAVCEILLDCFRHCGLPPAWKASCVLAIFYVLFAAFWDYFAVCGFVYEAYFTDLYCVNCGDICCGPCSLWHVKTSFLVLSLSGTVICLGVCLSKEHTVANESNYDAMTREENEMELELSISIPTYTDNEKLRQPELS